MNPSTTDLPPLFLQRLQQLMPTDYFSRCVATFTAQQPTACLINTLKESASHLQEQLKKQGFQLHPLSWHPHAFLIEPQQKRALTETSFFQEGQIYLLNTTSLIPPLLLAPQSGEEILDLAAAPGGKTIQLAIQMKNQGRLAAVEAVKDRFFRLKTNLKKYGVTIAQTYLKDGVTVGRLCPERFDRILLDAPCSSEARFKTTDPKTFAYWSEKKIKAMQKKQQQLLHSAILALKSGGTLIYCTCSFAPEENEAVIDRQLKKFGETIKIEPIDIAFTAIQPGLLQWQNKSFHPSLKHAVRILPDETMQGFFICKLIKY